MPRRKVTDRDVVNKYMQLQNSATGRKIPFNLSIRRVRQLLSTTVCYYTGAKLNETQDDRNCRSIERVDNTKGYIDDNVVACGKLVNSLRNNLTLSEIEGVVRGIKRHQAKEKLKQKKNVGR